jgi:hypothetical protein
MLSRYMQNKALRYLLYLNQYIIEINQDEASPAVARSVPVDMDRQCVAHSIRRNTAGVDASVMGDISRSITR